ncbi:MAG TPA: SPOR domain-containing protein, partial [Thermoanaerobaculia bacterium]|nr:SPOR domain-containing protein [Thermoanaerobaculia bacterium]
MRKQVASDGETVERVPLPPSETPSDGTGERYVLQLGAFQIEQNARELKQKAGAITGNVFIETSEGLHRVRVGPFDSKVT